MRWGIRTAGIAVHPLPNGYDGEIWAWTLIDEDGRELRTVRVMISGTAMLADDVHFRLDAARQSRGQTEIHRVLDWNEPPDEIEFFSVSESPRITGGDPGPEVIEIAETSDWFQERGISLVFSGRLTVSGAGTPIHQVEAANLLDYAADLLVERFEAGSTLEAARRARAWWERERERPGASKVTSPASVDAGEAAGHPVLRHEIAELRSHGYRIVWKEIGREGTPLWMVDVYGDDGSRASGIGDDREEALLEVYEELLPPDHE